MPSLLMIRERLRALYARFDIYIDAILKFVIALSAILLLNHSIGYEDMLKNPLIIISISLICAILPYGGIAWILSGCILYHIYGISSEMFLMTGSYLAVVALMYYGFKPGDSYILILTPIMYAFKIPYVIPILVGLGGSLISIIPVSCGIILYYVLSYVKNNAGMLTNSSAYDITQRYAQIIGSIMTDPMIWIYIITFAITIIVVRVIRKLYVDYAWIIAIISGVATMLISMFVISISIGLTMAVLPIIVGVSISALVALVYDFFIFNVDYMRTEYTQFEDDEYKYFVKAVPKINISVTEPVVRRYTKTKKVKKEDIDIQDNHNQS